MFKGLGSKGLGFSLVSGLGFRAYVLGVGASRVYGRLSGFLESMVEPVVIFQDSSCISACRNRNIFACIQKDWSFGWREDENLQLQFVSDPRMHVVSCTSFYVRI